MIGGSRPPVLISVPSAPFTRPFVPYVWALLKTYWEEHGIVDGYEWLPPIFLNDDPAVLLRPYDLSSVDVLGLSCYVWNFRLQCEVARLAKIANPRMLIVAGGPEPDCKDGRFFQRHPYIDVVVTKDGEIAFSRILEARLLGYGDLTLIPGLHLPRSNGALHSTGTPPLPQLVGQSPYLAQTAYFESLKRDYPRFDFHAAWESTRGCPYSCSFCDWGSNTMSKLRRVDLSRIEAELEWFGHIGIQYLISIDANFGILPRDVDIAELLCSVHRRYGAPRLFYYSSAKNHPERAVAIAVKLTQARLCRSHILAVQHTRANVLRATARENISPAKQIETARTLLDNGVPIDVQLIVGIPGDSYEDWTGCLGDLMEWGIHGDYTCFFYTLLPNAPAADPDFIARWEPSVVERFVLPDPNFVWKGPALDGVRTPVSPVVVASRSYTKADWVRMCAFAAFVKALHCGAVTRGVAMYLRWTHGIAYSEFYRDLVEHCVSRCRPWAALYERVSAQYERLIDDADASDFMYLEWLPSYSYGLDPSRWILANVCRDPDQCLDVVRTYLSARYPQVPSLRSVVDYQRKVLILPEYDRRVGVEFTIENNWPDYFRQAHGRVGPNAQPEPAPGSFLVSANDQELEDERGSTGVALRWEHLNGSQRWREWVTRVLERRHSSQTRNFQHLSVQPAIATPPEVT